jgi:hypothetical protein
MTKRTPTRAHPGSMPRLQAHTPFGTARHLASAFGAQATNADAIVSGTACCSFGYLVSGARPMFNESSQEWKLHRRSRYVATNPEDASQRPQARPSLDQSRTFFCKWMNALYLHCMMSMKVSHQNRLVTPQPLDRARDHRLKSLPSKFSLDLDNMNQRGEQQIKHWLGRLGMRFARCARSVDRCDLPECFFELRVLKNVNLAALVIRKSLAM